MNKITKPSFPALVDVRDEATIASAKTVVESVVEGEGLNLLINNAAISKKRGFFDVTKEVMLEIFEVNTVGPLLVSQVQNDLQSDLQTNTLVNEVNVCYSIFMQ